MVAMSPSVVKDLTPPTVPVAYIEVCFCSNLSYSSGTATIIAKITA